MFLKKFEKTLILNSKTFKNPERLITKRIQSVQPNLTDDDGIEREKKTIFNETRK